MVSWLAEGHIINMKRANTTVCWICVKLLLLCVFASCDDDDDVKVNPQICGVWMAQSFEYYLNGEYSKAENPIKKILEFKEDGTYREHLYSDYDKKLTSYSEHGWGYDSGSKILQLWGSIKYEVLELNNSTLKLKDVDNKNYGIYTYRKLSQSECEFYGLSSAFGNDGGSSSAAIPTSLIDKYIHFYYDDNSISDFVIWNISASGASIEKGVEQVYYTANSGPTYTYSVTGGRTAEYSITFQKWAFVMGTQIIGNPLTRSFVLTFYNDEESRGTFVQIGSGSDKQYTGRFYIGGKAGI